MKKKKIIVILALVCSILIFSKTYAVEEFKIDNKDRYNIIVNAFEEWIEAYKNEETPEDRRIIDYTVGAVGEKESNSEKIRAYIEFAVTPISKENTKWQYIEPQPFMINGKEHFQTVRANICFLEMTNINGKYEIDFISETPKGYDEFLKRFEEYKANLPKEEEVNTEQIQGKETDTNLANQEIDKMSNGIVIGCGAVLLLTVSVDIIRISLIIKRAKNKKL